MIRRDKTRPGRKGMSIVEFAIVVPIFLLFVFAIIEIARGMMTVHLLTNAARAGCREGILAGKSTADITNTVNGLLTPQGVPGTTTTVQVKGVVADASTAQSNDEITVIVTVPVASVTWLPFAGFLKGNLTGRYTLRRE